ncbi:hypothetical protein Tco_0701199 [Tanacetum coccineum]
MYWSVPCSKASNRVRSRYGTFLQYDLLRWKDGTCCSAHLLRGKDGKSCSLHPLRWKDGKRGAVHLLRRKDGTFCSVHLLQWKEGILTFKGQGYVPRYHDVRIHIFTSYVHDHAYRSIYVRQTSKDDRPSASVKSFRYAKDGPHFRSLSKASSWSSGIDVRYGHAKSKHQLKPVRLSKRDVHRIRVELPVH